MIVPKTNTQTGQSPVDRRALALRDAVLPQQQALANHALYARLSSLETVRLFMEHHVFAVWDSMSLLKALQAELSCVQLPWIPKGDPELRRFVNEIVLREESDEDLDGVRSHFETYLLAMWEAGADTRSIVAFLVQLRAGRSVANALAAAEAPRPARSFVAATWQVASSGEAHRVAAAFALGREELIPDMFLTALDHLDQNEGGCLQRFRHYLSRHGELDRQLHGPAALRMLTALCDDEPELWKEAGTAARGALLSRKALWDAILDATNKAGRRRGNMQHHGAQSSWPRSV